MGLFLLQIFTKDLKYQSISGCKGISKYIRLQRYIKVYQVAKVYQSISGYWVCGKDFVWFLKLALRIGVKLALRGLRIGVKLALRGLRTALRIGVKYLCLIIISYKICFK